MAAVLLLLVLANPIRVPVSFLFWTQELELYKVVIGSAVFGIVAAVVYLGHVKHLRRSRRLR